MQAADTRCRKRQGRDAACAANPYYGDPRTAQRDLRLPGTGPRRQVQPSEVAASPVVPILVTLSQLRRVWGSSIFHIARLDELGDGRTHGLGRYGWMQPDPAGSSISAAMPYDTPPILILLPPMRCGACSALTHGCRIDVAAPDPDLGNASMTSVTHPSRWSSY